MNSNNVITFPKKNKKSLNYSLDEIQYNLDGMKYYHIQETLQNLTPLLFNSLEISGFNIDDEDEEIKTENLKLLAFMSESIRSFLCKQYGLPHPFQIIAENVFIESINDEDERVLNVADTLNVTLKDEENK